MADGESMTATRREARHKPKTHFERRATAAMEKHLPKPEWSIRQKLALTARMLAAVEEAAVRARTIEHAARLQLLAMAAGTIRELPPALGRQAHDYRLEPAPLNATFHYYARLVLQAAPECLDEEV